MKPKIIIPILIVIALIGGSAYMYTTQFQSKANSTLPSNESITVSPQEAKTSVTIDSVTLAKPGFVAIRGSDGKRLGQIIEISKYLEVGTNKNITIELGDFYTYDEKDQPIAMIYHDGDGDKVFNDLDQPADSATSVFAKTGTLVPASVLTQEAVPMNGMGMATVVYTNDGFRPKSLTVPVGTMVEFVNQSDKEMWVASNVHPSHEILPTFDEFEGVAKGKTYMYTFDKNGTWPYHDHINASFEGVIIAE